jgi:hypothetical protein
MTRFYLDPDWLDSDYKSDSEEEWESVASESPDWYEECMTIIDYSDALPEGSQLIKRCTILVIVCLIDIDVVVIVIEVHNSGVILHYIRQSW